MTRERSGQKPPVSPEEHLKAVASFPAIHGSRFELESALADFDYRMGVFEATPVSEGKDPLAAFGSAQFYLAYSDCDVRPRLERISAAFRRTFPSLNWSSLPVSKPENRPIRIGFASRYLFNHTIAKLFSGLISGLAEEGFDVILIRDRRKQDLLRDAVLSFGKPEHLRAIQAITHPVGVRETILPQDLASARRTIANLHLDVLVYPDLGMWKKTWLLAFSRLAPIQVMTWGHPVTSGIGTIDYFLSSRQLDRDGAASDYTETLVQLTDPTSCYSRPKMLTESDQRSRAHFGLFEDRTVYLCPQSPFKIHPDFDGVMAGILSRDPNGEVVLLGGDSEWRTVLERRISRTIPEVASRVRFLPWVSQRDYLSLCRVADVLLDPVHFSGGNTSYEAFSVGAVIVCETGKYLRSRVTSALYHQMGLSEFIARDRSDYVDRAVAIGTNSEYRETLRQRILSRSERLFENRRVIEELADFLRAAVRAQRAGAAPVRW